MNIIDKKVQDEHCTQYKFDNGAWVSIDAGYKHSEGSWEYMSDEDNEDTYSEGGLWFEGKELVDYDGCFELPKEVVYALNDLGYGTSL